MIKTLVKAFLCPSLTSTSLAIALATCALTACSNSELPSGFSGYECTSIGYVPLDDTNYPYAGLPRIAIETESHRAIKDRETEIPAKLQIWGESAPESDVSDLTIRGRGNTSWEAPKKSYKIEFSIKQPMLGMPMDKDWALIGNYADKTLMKNYIMYNLAAKTGAYYTPRCEFVELYINKEYLGVYLLTETIKIGRNRVNIPKNNSSYIVEFDAKYRNDEQVFFSQTIQADPKVMAYRVHEPKNASEDALADIETHVKDFETFLREIKHKKDNHLERWLDLEEYVKHYWTQEFSKNPDAWFLTSVYFSWVRGDVIKMGPVWDFDLAFGGHASELFPEETADLKRLSPEEWFTKGFYWNKYLFQDSIFASAVKKYWLENRDLFGSIIVEIDSTAAILYPAAVNNFKRWDILGSTKYTYHTKAFDSYDNAIDDLKKWIQDRIVWIDKEY